MIQKRIVGITGGSGFLGINLIRDLLLRGVEEIRSLDLVAFSYPEATHPRIKTTIGDIRDRSTVRQFVIGCTEIIHAAAALPLYSKEDIFSTDIEGSKIIVEEALAAGVKRFVHISSTAVYGIPNHHPIYESDPLVGVGPYGIAKIEAEKACTWARDKGTMTVSILRPKSFIGPERLGVFTLLYDWAKTGHNFPMIGSGNNRYQLLDVDDLCSAIHACLTLPTAQVNDTFNIGAKSFMTMKEDYQVVLDQAGFGKRIIGTPAWPVIWTLRFLEALHLSPLYKWVYETASEDSFVAIDHAEAQLGFTPRYSNQQALLRNYAWYVTNIKTFEHVSGVSHRVPWKQGVIGLIKAFF